MKHRVLLMDYFDLCKRKKRKKGRHIEMDWSTEKKKSLFNWQSDSIIVKCLEDWVICWAVKEIDLDWLFLRIWHRLRSLAAFWHKFDQIKPALYSDYVWTLSAYTLQTCAFPVFFSPFSLLHFFPVFIVDSNNSPTSFTFRGICRRHVLYMFKHTTLRD